MNRRIVQIFHLQNVDLFPNPIVQELNYLLHTSFGNNWANNVFIYA